MYFETQSTFLFFLFVIMLKREFILIKKAVRWHYNVAEAGEKTLSALPQSEWIYYKSLFWYAIWGTLRSAVLILLSWQASQTTFFSSTRHLWLFGCGPEMCKPKAIQL